MLELQSKKLLFQQVFLTIQAKKLVLVLETSLLMTEISIKDKNQQLKCFSFIWYQVKFKKDYIKVQNLINFDKKINAMTSAYAVVLGLRVYFTKVEA